MLLWIWSGFVLGSLTQAKKYQGPLDYTFEHRHSLYAPFIDSKGQSNTWDIDGIVTNHRQIQLTPDLPSRSGSVFTKDRFRSDDWFIETTFQIKAKHPHAAGDGMALWFVEEPFAPGTAFGHQERFKGLGVFFDIFPNTKHSQRFPYVSAMTNDGNTSYDHVNDGIGQVMAGCYANILNTDTPIHAKVVYHNNVLDVLLFLNHESGWVPCLKVQNVKLPPAGYIGMTAMTGDASAEHSISAITTGRYSAKGGGDSFANAELEEMEQRHSTLFFVILLIVLAAFAYNHHKNQQKKNVF